MCVFVVRNRDKRNYSCPELDAGCARRGDVIEILSDDFYAKYGLGKAGNEYDGWTIVFLPGVPAFSMMMYKLARYDLFDDSEGPVDKNALMAKRGYSFDLDTWEARGKKSLTQVEATMLFSEKEIIRDPRAAPVEVK